MIRWRFECWKQLEKKNWKSLEKLEKLQLRINCISFYIVLKCESEETFIV